MDFSYIQKPLTALWVFALSFFFFFSLSPPLQAANTSFSVIYYPLNEASYDVPINGVINIPQPFLEPESCVEKLINSKGKINQKEVNTCNFFKRNHLEYCVDIVKSFFKSYEGHKRMAVIETRKNKNAFLYLGMLDSGSGGGHHIWSLYQLPHDRDGNLLCTDNPFLSGIEITPGGTTWVEAYCRKNESYKHCVERVLYPKNHAFQILFTEEGIVTRQLPSNSPTPLIPFKKAPKMKDVSSKPLP